MGLFSKDDLNLSAIRTEDMSSTIPYLKNLTNDAESLISRLNTNNKNLLFSESENYDMYNLFQKSNGISNDNFSETSPFISSDLYNNMVNKNMTGGGEESSSSSSSSSDSDKKKKKKHKKKSPTEESPEEKSPSEESPEEMLGSGAESHSTVVSEDSEASYESSSAHTQGSDDISTVSHHKSRRDYSESVNTSDINIISVDE
jgi:hypothetical protein